MQLTEREKQLAAEAARIAIADFLPALGVPPDTPVKEVHKLLTARALFEDPGFAEDLAFIRRLRGTTEKVAEQGIKTMVSIFVTVLLGIVLLGTKDWWLRHVVGG